MVGISEAVHEIDGLPLTASSDIINHISLTSSLKSKKENEKKKDLISLYHRRQLKYIDLSLEQFFYQVFCKNQFQDDKEYQILMATGLNCKPVYPVDFYYARGMLILHKPWHQTKPLSFHDETKTIRTFLQILNQKKFPRSVELQNEIARKYSQESKIELIAKQGIVRGQDIDKDELDPDLRDEILECEFCSNKTDEMQMDDLIGNCRVNIVRDYDWTTPTFDKPRELTDTGQDYLNNLQKRYYDNSADLQIQEQRKKWQCLSNSRASRTSHFRTTHH